MEAASKGRHWRVGTWTMGSALLLSGVLMIAGRMSEAAWLDRVWLWWPLLAVMLGVEIMVYLRKSGQPNPVIRYDLFSIVMIGALGGLLLLLAGAQGAGLLDEIRGSLNAVRQTVDIEPFEVKLGSGVKRIVLQAEDGLGRPIRIDPAATSAEGAADVTVFGSCRATVNRNGDGAKPVSLAVSRTVGETLYVSIRRPAEAQGLREPGAQCSATVVLPATVPVELATGRNALSLPASGMPQGWGRSRMAH